MADDVPRLQWREAELPFDVGGFVRSKRAQVASAPDGGVYGVWKEEGYWCVAFRKALVDDWWAERDGMVLRSDAQLVAELWSVGAGDQLRSHTYEKANVYDLDDGGVVADWECACGARGTDLANIGEAHAAARAHWRAALRKAIEAAA
jgi:hypothetical protein